MYLAECSASQNNNQNAALPVAGNPINDANTGKTLGTVVDAQVCHNEHTNKDSIALLVVLGLTSDEQLPEVNGLRLTLLELYYPID